MYPPHYQFDVTKKNLFKQNVTENACASIRVLSVFVLFLNGGLKSHLQMDLLYFHIYTVYRTGVSRAELP